MRLLGRHLDLIRSERTVLDWQLQPLVLSGAIASDDLPLFLSKTCVQSIIIIGATLESEGQRRSNRA
jgi:hypothetical protein